MDSIAQRSSGERAPFLEIEGFTKLFGGVRAVDNVDFSIGPDEMRCVIGPNGCGKTTLFNLITGYHAADKRVDPLPGARCLWTAAA